MFGYARAARCKQTKMVRVALVNKAPEDDGE